MKQGKLTLSLNSTFSLSLSTSHKHIYSIIYANHTPTLFLPTDIAAIVIAADQPLSAVNSHCHRHHC
jgi:hypothetical protein